MTQVSNEVIMVTVKPNGIAEFFFRRDYKWLIKELRISSIRVHKEIFTQFELRFSDESDLMAALDWLIDYFKDMQMARDFSKETTPIVKWTHRHWY